MKLELRHILADYDNRVDFAIFDTTVHGINDGTRRVAKPMVFEALPEWGAVEQPTLSMHHEDATHFLRSVMDVAWKLGIRPTGYDNDLGATKHHLDDMRKIVFHKLGVRP